MNAKSSWRQGKFCVDMSFILQCHDISTHINVDKSTRKFRSIIDMDFSISIYRVSSNLTFAIMSEQPPAVATWTPRYLESEREQRNTGWSQSAHTPIKRISEHRDTISCHPLCRTNDLIDMKGRCCLKIAASITRCLFTSGQPRHI